MIIIERRFSGAPIVTPQRATAGARPTSGSILTGYAAVFDQEAVIAGFFREVIRRGAFLDAIRRDDVRALFNHESSWILGRSSARTLRLAEDARGLRYEIDVNPDDLMAQSVVAKVRRGDVSGSSFAFAVAVDDERWTFDQSHVKPLREIFRASLIDVSPVVVPAYEATTATAQ